MSSIRRSKRVKKQRTFYKIEEEVKRRLLVEKSEEEKKKQFLKKNISDLSNIFTKNFTDLLDENDSVDQQISNVIRYKKMLTNGINITKNIQSSSDEIYVRSDTNKNETYTIKKENGYYVCNCGFKYDILKRTYCKHIMSVVIKDFTDVSANCLRKSSDKNSSIDNAYLKFLKLNI